MSKAEQLIDQYLGEAGNPFATDDKLFIAAMRWTMCQAKKEDLALLKKKKLIGTHPETDAAYLKDRTAFDNAAMGDQKRLAKLMKQAGV